MIRVTIYNEFLQERMDTMQFPCMEGWKLDEAGRAHVAEQARLIRKLHNGGIHCTLQSLLEEDPELRVCHLGHADLPECGLTEEVLLDTDVLVWWGHVGHDMVPDAVAARVADHVRRGMGIMFLHSAHMCKPMALLLGTTCTLRWRDDDREELWCCNPTHPIARGVSPRIHLEPEEMYGEFFDIPTPDELVFLANFGGGEVFRSGCVWKRSYGKIFYFQPGHETNTAYHDPDVRRILRNAVHYLEPVVRMDKIECLPC